MLWDEVVGHTAVCLSLRKAVEQGHVNHAYMFTGPSAVGKFIVARTFAASILCPDGGCGKCNVCRRVMEEKHPDVRVIRPAGKNIPVDTIREVRMDAFKKPSESEHKIYIFKNAELMWEEGASTLLKVLEEPPGNVVFILLTASPGAVMPTIRSRCQEIRFSNVPLEDLKVYLLGHKDVTPERADLIVRLTGGVLGRALDWCDEPWRLTRRDNVIKTARALRRADLNHTLGMAQELYRDVRAPLDEVAGSYQLKKQDLDDGTLDDATARRIGKGLDEECRREQLKEEIRGVKEVLATLSWWYRDILIYGEGGEASLLVNRDMEQEVAEEAGALSPSNLLKCIDMLGDNMRAAEQNVPAQLNIESALFRIQEALYA
jgi:DNA polymerase III subunit delta'